MFRTCDSYSKLYLIFCATFCIVTKLSSLRLRFAFATQGMSSIMEAWISQANARQRSGRAGRVRSGNCFCLYTRNRLEKLMRPFQVLFFHPIRCMCIVAVSMSVLHSTDRFLDCFTVRSLECVNCTGGTSCSCSNIRLCSYTTFVHSFQKCYEFH